MEQHVPDRGGLFSPGVTEPVTCDSRPLDSISIAHDILITSYYKTFHRFHPIVVPKRNLVELYENQKWHSQLQPLLQVLRLIGRVYRSEQWSVELVEVVKRSIQQMPELNPVTVQCHLLFSITLFWHGNLDESQRHMKAAVRIARSLKMHLRAFAGENGDGDPVLTECWRRTWWTLYTVDAYYVGTLGTAEFAFEDLEITTELPCEEHEYESGVRETPQPCKLLRLTTLLQDDAAPEFSFRLRMS